MPYPVTILPPNLQERVRQSAQEINATRAKDPSKQGTLVSDQTVRVAVNLRLQLDAPSVGSIVMGGGLDSFLPQPDYNDPVPAGQPPAKTITLSGALKIGGVLCVTPESEEEVLSAIRAARLHGLKQVWIASPSEQEDPSQKQTDVGFQRILTAAIAEAGQSQEKPIEVLAVARVLSVPAMTAPKTDGRARADQNLSAADLNWDNQSVSQSIQNRLNHALIAGQDTRSLELINKTAREWLVPDDSLVIEQVNKRLSNLAATPGLGGIVLTDILAPGYRSPKNESRTYEGSYTDLGYTPHRRIDAIRAFGVDPVDIVLNWGYNSYGAPRPYLMEGSAQRIARQMANQTKKPADPSKADDLTTLAETSPLTAWNAQRFRAGSPLLDALYETLTGAARSRKVAFPIYLQSLRNGGGWFGTWDQRDKLPVALDRQEDENYSALSERSARAASVTVLYQHGYYPSPDPEDPANTTDMPPLLPAEKFAQDFNRIPSASKNSWDGYVFDLRNLPLSKALQVLQSVTPAAKVIRK